MMKAKMESTDQVVEMKASGHRVMCRVWEGVTEGGIAFTAYIITCQVKSSLNNDEFVRDLTESKPADADTLRAIDMRFIV